MTDNTYKVTEVVGTSTESVTHAIDNGIAKTAESVRNLDWFEVVEIRGHIQEHAVAHYQVVMKIGFRME